MWRSATRSSEHIGPTLKPRWRCCETTRLAASASSISEGEAWLDQALSELLDLLFAQQPRGPLEVFQEALGFLTPALTAAGVESVVRDEVTSNALPGDLYHLAPASSMEVGRRPGTLISLGERPRLPRWLCPIQRPLMSRDRCWWASSPAI